MLIQAFLKRRFWHIRHHWTGHLASLLLIPLALYFTLELSIGEWLQVVETKGISGDWLFPGILFIIALLAGMLSLWGDLQRSILSGFFDSIAASANGGSSIVASLIVSSILEILFRTIVAAVILIIMTGNTPAVLPFVGTVLMAVLAGLFGSSLVCLWFLAGNQRSNHFFGIFSVFLFLIFSSGWLIPLQLYPETLANVLAWLPTAQLMSAGRSLFIDGGLTGWVWILAVVETGLLVILSGILFRRVYSQ